MERVSERTIRRHLDEIDSLFSACFFELFSVLLITFQISISNRFRINHLLIAHSLQITKLNATREWKIDLIWIQDLKEKNLVPSRTKKSASERASESNVAHAIGKNHEQSPS